MRRSTLRMVSTKGMRKNRPGPRAATRRPRRKITPRSYSCTILIVALTSIKRTTATAPTITNIVMDIHSRAKWHDLAPPTRLEGIERTRRARDGAATDFSGDGGGRRALRADFVALITVPPPR